MSRTMHCRRILLGVALPTVMSTVRPTSTQPPPTTTPIARDAHTGAAPRNAQSHQDASAYQDGCSYTLVHQLPHGNF